MSKRITQRSYEDAEKERWHRSAWLTTIDKFSSKPVALRKVVYLDTCEALQTIRLLRRGYQPENLLAVNYLPVELALLTRRLDSLGLSRVNTISGDWERVVNGFGAVDVLDFDGMSHCGGSVGDVLLTNSVNATTPRILSFTILCGRENERGREFLKVLRPDLKVPLHDSFGRSFNPNHWQRVRGVLINALAHNDTCLFHVKQFAWCVYRSTSGQPMAWCAVRITPHVKDTASNLEEALIKLSTWRDLNDKEKNAAVTRCFELASRSIQRTTFDKWLYQHGLSPTCVQSALCEMGDDDDAPHVSLKNTVGLPDWSQDQFDYCGIVRSDKEFHPLAPKYRGWPKRIERVS